jgi:N-acetylmuramoyl-L-alanine amidase
MPPTITWIGASPANHFNGRAGYKPTRVISHIMYGTLAGTDAAFANPAHQASATYGIGADGAIHQYLREDDAPYANGPIRQPNLAAAPWVGDCIRNNHNPNYVTIAIEWEGRHRGGQWVNVPWAGGTLQTIRPGSIGPGEWWVPTEAQYQAGLWLHRQILARWGIPADRAHIGRHSDVDGVAKWWCPGDGFPLARLITDLGGHV